MKSPNQLLRKQLLAGILCLLCAVPIAYVVFYINNIFTDAPEKAVKIVGGIFLILAVLPPIIYLVNRRKSGRLGDLGLIVIGSVTVLLAACYFFQASFSIKFPADILIWSESEFVNDILKFRQNYPIYTADANNESFIYTPGTQLLTYFFAWLTGNATSIPAFRLVQVFYTILSAIVAFLCCRRLVKNVFPDSKIFASPLWGAVWLVGLFLIATNFLTNPFAHLLHNDALAQLVAVTAFWLLVEYETSRDKRILWLMILIPAIGFWVKQSLIIWAFIYTAYLLFFDRPRSFKKTFGFAFAAFGGVLLSIGIGYLIWQDSFIYWVFTVLGERGVSPLRSFQHLLDIWEYFAAGLIGGFILIQAGDFKKLFGLWLVWLAFISLETYTSGVAWMLNHIGPGCLIAGIWFWAGLAIVWNKNFSAAVKNASVNDWLKLAVGTIVICLSFSGLDVVRVPVQPFDYRDAERYVGEIENEFAGEKPKDVLLDIGTWVYLPNGTIMKDRASNIGDRGYAQNGDFSGILQRLENKKYKKILVRNFHSNDFWYDHELWSKTSGIRRALSENYREAGKIEAVKGLKPDETQYGFKEITILIPKEN